ncbi:hypothetical protein EES45_20090 [Streptomyces sp. ADI97-07]|nr:hypothetical protein EES45_20090 [Streptomyces sp. ADI97-07]
MVDGAVQNPGRAEGRPGRPGRAGELRAQNHFRGDPTLARPEKQVMTIPRAGLVRMEIRERLLNSSFVVSSPENEQGLRIIFPLVGREDRNALAAILPVAG